MRSVDRYRGSQRDYATNIYNTYLCHQQVSEPALQATSDSKHRHSLCVFDHHNVFSAQMAKSNNMSLITTKQP